MKAYTKDIIKTIVKGMKRFMALALIAALGVCMMTGLKAACDDLRYSADDFYDENLRISAKLTFPESDPDEILLIEAWESKKHQEIHIEQPHMAKFRDDVKDLRFSSNVTVVAPVK